MTRHLGVSDFGRFQTIISLITVVATVTDAGMATLGVREYAQRFGADRDGLMRTLLGLRLALTLLGVLIATAIALAVGYEWELVLGTALAGLGLALIVVQTTLTIPLAADLRNAALTALDVLRQALTVAGYVALVVAGATVVAFLGVTVPVGIVLVVVAATLVRGRVSLRPSVQLAEWGVLLRAAAAFAMATAVGTIYLYTSQILTAAVSDARDTGLFSASFRVFVVIAAIPGLLLTVAFPLLSRAARDDRERLAYAVHRLFDTTTILGLGAAVGLVVGAPGVIEVMAGPDFADAAPALRIQAATLVATFVLAPIGFALLSLHAHRAILVANVVALAVMVGSVASLAPSLGPEGAAAGTVLGESALAAGYLWGLRRSAPTVAPGFGRGLRALSVAVPCLAFVALPASVAGGRGRGPDRLRDPARRCACGARGADGAGSAAGGPLSALRVGMNLVPIAREGGGIARYAVELVRALGERADVELHLFTSLDAPEDLAPGRWSPPARVTRLPVRVDGPPLHLAAQFGAVPALAALRRLEIVHSPANAGPVGIPGTASVITFHDTTWLRAPEQWGTPEAVRTMKRVAVPTVRRARRVIAGSRAAAADLERMLGVPAERIDVAPYGVRIEPDAPATPEGELRARLRLGEAPVVLCVAQKRPYKNQESLIRALTAEGLSAARLVLPGAHSEYETVLKGLALRLGVADRVVFPEWLEEPDLEGLYRLARCVALPSRLEGFGLPVLEAMARGVPVACSDRSALPEVAGDAAILFDPDDEGAVAAALARLLSDADLRDRLKTLGLARAARFTWQATADATLSSYRRALGR